MGRRMKGACNFNLDEHFENLLEIGENWLKICKGLRTKMLRTIV